MRHSLSIPGSGCVSGESTLMLCLNIFRDDEVYIKDYGALFKHLKVCHF